MSNTNGQSGPKTDQIVITPETYRLLEFLNPREVPSIVHDLEKVFDNAVFNSREDLQDHDKSSLYTLKTLTELITNLYNNE